MAALRSLSPWGSSRKLRPVPLHHREWWPSWGRPPWGVGTHRRGGFRRLCAFIAMRARGTRTLATATTAVCSSFSRRGGRSAAEASRTLRARVNSYTAPTSSTGATATHGASGAPQESAVCAEVVRDALYELGCEPCFADKDAALTALDQLQSRADAWERENRRLLGA